jgi:hypothetical protein
VIIRFSVLARFFSSFSFSDTGTTSRILVGPSCCSENATYRPQWLTVQKGTSFAAPTAAFRASLFESFLLGIVLFPADNCRLLEFDPSLLGVFCSVRSSSKQMALPNSWTGSVQFILSLLLKDGRGRGLLRWVFPFYCIR